LRFSSNVTPLGFGGAAADAGSGLGMALGGGLVAARLGLAEAVGIGVPVTAFPDVGTEAADGAGPAPHAATTHATITASATRL